MKWLNHHRTKSPRPQLLAAVALTLAALVQPQAAAAAQPAQLRLQPALQRFAAGDRELAAFYAARQHRPLWVRGASLGPEADMLLGLLRTAEADGREPGHYLGGGLLQAIDRARGGSPEALAFAEVALSRTFAAYVRDLRRPAEIGVVYGEPWLKHRIPNPLTVLTRAAAAPSLGEYLTRMGWMHPIYADLRNAMTRAPLNGGVMFGSEEQRVRLNLERARILPAHEDRYVVVDVASARLFYYEGGEVRDSMRVVVGAADEETPMMVGLLRQATLNPYWHVPPDLARERIAPRVLKEGLGYFHDRGYEAVTQWSATGTVIDPASIDWKAVAAGRKRLFVRQRPGPRNGMGKVKFEFPNALGIYLHDTPAKQLFDEAQRGLSAGCVRLEDADGFARLLFGRALPLTSQEPEQAVTLTKPVPVYITYLTAVAENGRIVARPDIYGRDKKLLAAAAEASSRSGVLR